MPDACGDGRARDGEMTDDAGDESQQGQANCTIRIVSPTPAIGNNRRYTLPISSTVGQLRAKVQTEIADALPLGAGFRLIIRGRLLATDTTTLNDVFKALSVCALTICAF